ncbi:MAG: chromosomal replication initiator protein DnaA [Muribaculaceae bacterium]|nr:chromosomal replication initiator protein DnaA [Muribaculaceae bacterium]
MNPNQDYKMLWSRCLDIIRDNVGEERFKTWFMPARAIKYEDNKLVLALPSKFFMEEYEDRFLGILSSVLRKVFGPEVRLGYEVEVIGGDKQSAVNYGSPLRSKAVDTKYQQQTQRPVSEFVKNTGAGGVDVDPQLNPAMTFENYCLGESNKLPCTLAKHIAENPNKSDFNPFFLYGAVGVGKTHLIQAIGIRIKENNPHARVLFLPMRQFQNMYVNAVLNHKLPVFINWFQQEVDVLLIDDLQEISGKEKTAETLFPIFNHMHHNGKQLVFTCDRPPVELDGIEDRLIDRFKWGVTEELPKPDYTLRRDILKFKAQKNGLALSDEIIDCIASGATGSVRELEGIVMGVLTRSIMLNCPVTLELTKEVMRHTVKTAPGNKPVNFDMIVDATAEYYKLNPDVIFSKSRVRDIADARQVIMFLSHDMTGLSSSAIGAKLNRKHATVLHGISAVQDRIKYAKDVQDAVTSIRSEIVRLAKL